MTTSHGTIQGYNANALADEKHQVIIYGEAFGNGQDYEHVSPMIDGAKTTMKNIGHPETYFEKKVFTADTSYHSEDNLATCTEERLDAYIPDNNFRLRDPRFSHHQSSKSGKTNEYTIDHFSYDPETDTFTCPNGKCVKRIWKKEVKMAGKYYAKYGADKHDCQMCPLRSHCMKNEKTPRRTLMQLIRRDESSLSNQMKDKIDTPKGRQVYGLRFAVIEPIFGNICINKGLNRFTLRTKAKVDIQWKLYCLVHNIEKIGKYGKGYLTDVIPV